MTGPATLLGALGGVPERGDRERGPVNGFLGCEDAVEALLNSAAAAVSSQVNNLLFLPCVKIMSLMSFIVVFKECRVDFTVSSLSSSVSGSFSEFKQQPGRLQQ